MSYIRSIDLRRVWIADEEHGLVFGLTMIHEIEAMGFSLPLYSKNGWSQFIR